jgi:hypothetical protein
MDYKYEVFNYEPFGGVPSFSCSLSHGGEVYELAGFGALSRVSAFKELWKKVYMGEVI